MMMKRCSSPINHDLFTPNKAEAGLTATGTEVLKGQTQDCVCVSERTHPPLQFFVF